MFCNVGEDGRAILLRVVFLVREGMFCNVWGDGRAILLGVVFLVREGMFLECLGRYLSNPFRNCTFRKGDCLVMYGKIDEQFFHKLSFS